jgi:hypothetical protein
MNAFPEVPFGTRPSRAGHPLLRIAVAAALATTITWLGGLLFGPVSDARARQLAEGLSAPAHHAKNEAGDVSTVLSGQRPAARMS